MSPTYPDTTRPFPKDSTILLARGNIMFRAIVTPITRGMIKRYAGLMLERNNKVARYTEKRTTAFKAVDTGISAVGTNLDHVS
jgi:hypothetical protein